MAKRLEFLIDDYQADWMFRPLRSKRDALLLLMRVVKFVLSYPYIPKTKKEAGKIVLYIDKMSRLFFVGQNKVFSLAIPFAVRESSGLVEFGDSFHESIDNKLTSEVLAFLEDDAALVGADLWSFLEPLHYQSEFDQNFWQFVRKLLLYDDGYIRYDFDEKNEDGRRHPLHHLDVFYESQSTFKLGLASPLDGDGLRDVVDITTDCYYAGKLKA